MIKLERDLNFYSNYFNGFEKILAYRSFSETAAGAVQVLSYGTIVCPLIFAIGCQIASSELQNAKRLERKVLNHLWFPTDPIPSQKEYIDFLTLQAEDKKYKVISEIFPKLEPSFQREFSYFMSKQRKFSILLDHIPEASERIELKLADPLSMASPQKAALLVNGFFKKLARLQELENLTLDIQDIAFYAEGFRRKMPEFLASLESPVRPVGRRRHAFLPQIARRKTSPEEIKNSLNLASRIVVELVKYLRRTESLQQVTICFSDHTLTVRKGDPSDDLSIQTDFESIYSIPLV